ncbi:unnamed protein product [Scytosiphon promiscuus]
MVRVTWMSCLFQVARYKEENERARLARRKQETALAEVMRKRQEVREWAEAERAAVEAWCTEQRQASAREKRAAVKQVQGLRARALAGGGLGGGTATERRQRQEIEGLKATIERAKLDAETAKKKARASERRLQQQIKAGAERVAELEGQVSFLERQRVEVWASATAGSLGAPVGGGRIPPKAGVASGLSRSMNGESVGAPRHAAMGTARSSRGASGGRPAEGGRAVSDVGRRNPQGAAAGRRYQWADARSHQEKTIRFAEGGLTPGRRRQGASERFVGNGNSTAPDNGKGDPAIRRDEDGPQRHARRPREAGGGGGQPGRPGDWHHPNAPVTSRRTEGDRVERQEDGEVFVDGHAGFVEGLNGNISTNREINGTNDAARPTASSSDSVKYDPLRYEMAVAGATSSRASAAGGGRGVVEGGEAGTRTGGAAGAGSDRQQSREVVGGSAGVGAPGGVHGGGVGGSGAAEPEGWRDPNDGREEEGTLAFADGDRGRPVERDPRQAFDAKMVGVDDSPHRSRDYSNGREEKAGVYRGDPGAMGEADRPRAAAVPAGGGLSSSAGGAAKGGGARSGGKVEHVLRDGRRVILFANGTQKEMLPDGGCVVRFVNGDLKRVEGGTGVVVYTYAAARTTHTMHPSGLEVFEFPSGQVERHHKTGEKEIHFPDGTRKYILPSGREMSEFPDGVTVVEYPEGHRDVTSPNGTTHRERPDGTVETPPQAKARRGDGVVSREGGTGADATGGGRIHPKLLAATGGASRGGW